MQVYENLLEEVNKYVAREPIQDTDEVISAYTLWTALKYEANKLNYVYRENQDLLDFVNYIYREAHSVPDLYETATENLGEVKIPLFRPLQFSSVKAAVGNKGVSFYFYATGKNNEFYHNCVCVERDFFDDSYYGEHANSFLVRNCKPLLDAKFEFMKFVAEIKTNSYEQVIKSSPFEIKMSHLYEDKPKLYVSLDKNTDPSDSQYKKYYDKTQTIDEVVTKQCSKILQVTPVEVASLNGFCSAILNRYLNEKDQTPIGFGLNPKEEDKPKQLKKNRNN